METTTFNTYDGSICLWASFVLQIIFDAFNFHLYLCSTIFNQKLVLYSVAHLFCKWVTITISWDLYLSSAYCYIMGRLDLA